MSQMPKPGRARFKWRPACYALIGVVLLIWIVSWSFLAWFAPAMVRQQAERWAQGLGRTLTIGQIEIRPWTLSLELDQVRLQDRDGSTLFAAHRIELEMMPRALLIGHWHAELLAMSKPELNLVRHASGSWNWGRFIQEALGPSRPGSKPPSLILDWLSLHNGHIRIVDQFAGVNQHYDVQNVSFNLYNLSTISSEGGYSLSATLGKGTRLKWRGLLGIEPLASAGRITLSHLELSQVWPYLQPYLRLSPPAGRLSFDLNYVFDLKGRQPNVTFSSFFAHIDDFSVVSPGQSSQFSLAKLMLDDGIFDWQKRLLFFKRIRLLNGHLSAERNERGQIDWLAMLPPAPATGRVQHAAASAPPWGIQVNDISLENWQLAVLDKQTPRPLRVVARMPRLALSLSQTPQQGLRLMHGQLALQNLELGESGARLPWLRLPALTLSGAQLEGDQLQSGKLKLDGPELTIERDRQGQINLLRLLALKGKTSAGADSGPELKIVWPQVQLNNGRLSWRDLGFATPVVLALDHLQAALKPSSPRGLLDWDLSARSGNGHLNLQGRLDPAQGQLQGQLQSVALPLAPYALAHTPLAMPRGTLSSQLKIDYAHGQWQLSGGVRINDLLIRELGTTEPLMAWQALQLDGLKLQSNPLKLGVQKVRLDRPTLRFILDHNRVSNLHRLFMGNQPTAPVSAKTSAPLPLAFDIRMIHVRNGHLDFADQGMKPAFHSRINHLGGTISNLSSRPDRRGAVALNGTVDRAGDVRVRGALSPLAVTDNSDISLIFRNIPLSSLNPYSENFAGWQIEEGRLSVDLHYLLTHRQLQGDNRVVIDSIKLGAQLERPGVSRLPLSLAIAILEDSHGRIDLHLPVSGKLDDPKFSYGGLIWQALVNVVEKVVTAPFRALGALLGIQGFDAVRFIAGEATVTPPEREKLDQLAQMLQQRPQLTLKMTGTYDPEADASELARARADRAILQAAGITLAADEPLPAVDVQDSGMQAAIRQVYAQRIGRLKLMARLVTEHGKPGEYAGLRQEIVQAEPVSQADLLALANSRAHNAAVFLQKTLPDLADHVSVATPVKTVRASADGVALDIALLGR